jgi:hypothetical protein
MDKVSQVFCQFNSRFRLIFVVPGVEYQRAADGNGAASMRLHCQATFALAKVQRMLRRFHAGIEIQPMTLEHIRRNSRRHYIYIWDISED